MNARPCRDVRAGLSAYLEGDLDAGLTGEIRLHLESCAACRSELDLLRLTIGALRSLPDLPPPAAILAGVRARLRPEPWYRRLLDGRQWPLGVPVGALATLLVAFGISLFQTRFPDMSQTLPQGPIPQAPAPHALEIPAPPTSIAPPPPAARNKPALRRVAPPPVAVEQVAPTAAQSKGEQSHPSHPEPRVAATQDALREESPRRENFAVALKESAGVTARKADIGAGQGRAKLAGEKTKWVEVVCLLPADGNTVDDIERLLRREGAVDILTGAIEPPAVREAFDPHRLRLGSLLEPSRGWMVTASVPPRAFARLLHALSSRPDLRILEQPDRRPAPEDTTEPLELRITILR
jgi:anti-sigma factor RsiW